MNKVVLLVIASSLSVSVSIAAANPVTISASTEDGLYTRVICPSLTKALHAKGIQAVCKTSSGSGQNFERVAKGEVTAGLMQKDALYGLASQGDNPDANNYIALGSLTPEAIWMVALSGSKVTFNSFIKNYSENSAPKLPLVIGVAGDSLSGSYLTMTQAIVNNLPSLKKNIEAGYVKLISLNNIPPNVAYYQLGNKLDAVMFVQMPDLKHERIQDVLNSDGKYVFLDISSPQLTQLSFSNQPIYREVDIHLQKRSSNDRITSAWNVLMGKKITTNGKQKSVHTLVTETTLLINPATVNSKIMSALSSVVNSKYLLPKNTVAGTASLWWQKLKKASEQLTSN